MAEKPKTWFESLPLADPRPADAPAVVPVTATESRQNQEEPQDFAAWFNTLPTVEVALDRRPTAAPVGPVEEVSGFTGGVRTGWQGLKSSVGGAIEMAGSALDSETLRETGAGIREDAAARLRQIRPRVGRLEEISDAGDALEYILYQAGNAVPSVGASVAAGTGAAIVAPAAAATVATVGAAGAVSYILNAGEVYADLREEGFDAPGAAAAAGIPMALLDVVVPTKVTGRLVFKDVGHATLGELLKKAGRTAAVEGAQEGLTEAGQEAIGKGVVTSYTDEDFFTTETAADLLNAFAGGAIGGGTFSGGSEIVAGIRPRKGTDADLGVSDFQAGIEEEVAAEATTFDPDNLPHPDTLKGSDPIVIPPPEAEPQLSPPDTLEGEPQPGPVEVEPELPHPDTLEPESPPDLSTLFTEPEPEPTPIEPEDSTIPRGFEDEPKPEPEPTGTPKPPPVQQEAASPRGIRAEEAESYDPEKVSLPRIALHMRQPQFALADGEPNYALPSLQRDLRALHKRGLSEEKAYDLVSRYRGETEASLNKDSFTFAYATASMTADKGPVHVVGAHNNLIGYKNLFKSVTDGETVFVFPHESAQPDRQNTFYQHLNDGYAIFLPETAPQSAAVRAAAHVVADKYVRQLPKEQVKAIREAYGATYSVNFEGVERYKALPKDVPPLPVDEYGHTNAGMFDVPARIALFNQKFFGGKLNFERVETKYATGGAVAHFDWYDKLLAFPVNKSFPPEIFDGILLHEMAHAEDKQNYKVSVDRGQYLIGKEEPHGDSFQRIAKRLEQESGIKNIGSPVLEANLSRALYGKKAPEWETTTGDGVRVPSEIESIGEWLFRNLDNVPELQRLGSLLRGMYNIYKPATSFDSFVQELGKGSELHADRFGLDAGIKTENMPALNTTPYATFETESMKEWQGVPETLRQASKDVLDPALQKQLNGDIDKASWWARNLLAPFQFAKLNPHIKPLQDFIRHIQEWWADKTIFDSRSAQRLTAWAKLGKSQADKVGRYFYEMTLTSDKLGRKLTPEELRGLRKKWGLSKEAEQLADAVAGDFQAVVDALKVEAYKEVEALIAAGDPEGAQALKQELDKDFAALERRNYFPLTRFGQHVVELVAKKDGTIEGQFFKEGQTIAFATFESKKEQRQYRERMLKQYGSRAVVRTDVLKDIEFAFQGFPPSLVNLLSKEMNLSPQEQKQLQRVTNKFSPGSSFRKHLLDRDGVAGFSLNAQRVYASYMFHGSNHIARIRHYKDLRNDIQNVGHEANQLVNAEGRRMIQKYMQRTYEYAMNPGNEWASFRGGVFMWYFFANLKQPIINMTQVPIVSANYLAAKYGKGLTGGYAAVGKALTKAYKTTFRSMRDMTAIDSATAALIERGIREGILNESFASMMAAASAGDVLQRGMGTNKYMNSLRDVLNKGVRLFALTEEINRRATFLATLDMLPKDLSPEARYQAAKEAVQVTQAEYNRWNRIPIARGKIGTIFIFKTFLQNMIWFMATQPGGLRTLGLMFAIAGISGIPGADDLLDLIDIAIDQINKRLGLTHKRVDLRVMAREAVASLGVAPDLAMHGAARYTFGLHGLNLLFGAPIPAVDFAGSMAMGRVLPGVRAAHDAYFGRDPMGEVGAASADLLGPSAAIGLNFWKALNSRDPSEWRRWERAVPPALANVSKALRAMYEGKFVDQNGNKLISIDPYDVEHWAEVAFQAIGVRPTQAAQIQESDWAKTESVMYYRIKREIIFNAFAFAREWNDPEAMADVRRELTEYNKDAPPGMKISSPELYRSFISRVRGRRLRELGLPAARRYAPQYREIDEAYPEARAARAERPVATSPQP